MSERIKLADVVTTAGTQIRARVDAETVDQYASAMFEGASFPPVSLFHDGNQFVLADGFHRVMAASRNGYADIEAEIRKGTKSDALRFALSANAAHGLKRTNSDKRRSVVLALAEWPKLSDREIARICAVSNNFVSEQRRELSSDDGCPDETRIGGDGKERRLPKRQEPEPEPEPQPTPAELPTSAPENLVPVVSEPTQPPEPTRAAPAAPRNHFAAQVEDIVADALGRATAKQLHAMVLAMEVGIRRIRRKGVGGD